MRAMTAWNGNYLQFLRNVIFSSRDTGNHGNESPVTRHTSLIQKVSKEEVPHMFCLQFFHFFFREINCEINRC